ncbi:MAG: hypothetical protein IJV61_00025 [Paludibacteraceae bacterium]|nr:hypothetical protein [Paludibacteraceae bacterium]
MERCLAGNLLENRKFTKTVGQFAEWVAEYVFRNQMELWGEQMEQEEDILCEGDGYATLDARVSPPAPYRGREKS